jgi:hypothetical protein
VAPGSEIVCGRMGGGTLKVIPGAGNDRRSVRK